MKKNNLLIILIILILGVGGLIYYNLFVISKKPAEEVTTPSPATVQQQEASVPTLEPTLAQKTQEVLQRGGTIPFDYEVTSVEKDKLWLKGLRGDMLLTEGPNIEFFFKTDETVTPATFADFKVGQKIVIETTAPPNRQIKVYIVGQ